MRASVDLVPADPVEAERRLDQARRHFETAQIPGSNAASAYLLLYAAAHGAATAALLASGKRVTGGDAAHAVLFSEARRLLGADHEALLERVDVARQLRNGVAYDAADVTDTQIESLRFAVTAIIDLVQERLR